MTSHLDIVYMLIMKLQKPLGKQYITKYLNTTKFEHIAKE